MAIDVENTTQAHVTKIKTSSVRLVKELYPRLAEDNAAIERYRAAIGEKIDWDTIPLLQAGDPHTYSCLTTDPYCLWTIEPCPPQGWSVRMDDLANKYWSATNGGFHQDAVALTLHLWGLTGPVQWEVHIPHPKEPEKREMVYAIGQANGGLVKIGRSNDVSYRLANIQRMSPVPLVVLWQRPGYAELETRLHRAFANRRTYGEWFDFSGVDLIAALEGEMNR
jgi:hypothetical protein